MNELCPLCVLFSLFFMPNIECIFDVSPVNSLNTFRPYSSFILPAKYFFIIITKIFTVFRVIS